MFIQNKS